MRCSLHSHRQWYFVFLSLPPILFRYVQKREEALRNGPTFIQTKWTLSNCLLPLNRATALKFFRCMRWQETEKGNRHIFFFSFYSYSLYIFLNLFFFSIRYHLVSYIYFSFSIPSFFCYYCRCFSNFLYSGLFGLLRKSWERSVALSGTRLSIGVG